LREAFDFLVFTCLPEELRNLVQRQLVDVVKLFAVIGQQILGFLGREFLRLGIRDIVVLGKSGGHSEQQRAEQRSDQQADRLLHGKSPSRKREATRASRLKVPTDEER